MGIFDKAKDLINEHGDKIDQGIDKAGDFIDAKTGGKYADQVDSFQQQAKDRLDEFAGADPANPNPADPNHLDPDPVDPSPADPARPDQTPPAGV